MVNMLGPNPLLAQVVPLISVGLQVVIKLTIYLLAGLERVDFYLVVVLESIAGYLPTQGVSHVGFHKVPVSILLLNMYMRLLGGLERKHEL